MFCPHCTVSVHPKWGQIFEESDREGRLTLHRMICPSCKRFIIAMRRGLDERYLYPKASTRKPVPSEVPDGYAEDFREACLVFSDSPKASAALSRRCLQNLLRGQAGVKPQDLSKEIDEVLASKVLPPHLAGAIDAIRQIGNFAAHPVKSQNSGEVLPVEPGEAEWLLDVLDGLFEFYFVQPAILSKRKAALDAKLAEAGKPPMK